MDSRQFEKQLRRLRKRNPRVQIHVSSHDLIQIERAKIERRERARAATLARIADFQVRFASNRPLDRDLHTAKMMQLSPKALKLHSPRIAGILLGVYGLSLLACAALPFLLIIVIPICITISVIDWHNTVTLHGWLPWRAAWRSGELGQGYVITGAAAFTCVFLFVPVIYLIQAWALAGHVRELERAKLRAEITKLEADLGLPPLDEVHRS